MCDILIASPSPRDISEVQEAMDEIQEDKLFVKYFKEKEAYSLIRQLFLDSKKTHLCLCPDDLIVTNEVFQKLKDKVKELDLPVLAGYCNLSWQEQNVYSFAMNVSGFQFVDKQKLSSLAKQNPGNILKVGHEGFACTFVRRDVVEKVSFQGVNDEKDAHFDWAFSLECARLGIPLYVDLTAKLVHLKDRLGKDVYEKWGVGKKEPIIIFENND